MQRTIDQGVPNPKGYIYNAIMLLPLHRRLSNTAGEEVGLL